MDVILFVLALLCACALVLLPGALILAGLGIGGLARWAVAPALSTALVAVSAVVFDVLGVEWGLASAIIPLVAVPALVWGVGALLSRRSARLPDRTRRFSVLILVGLLIGAVLIGVRLALYLPSVDAVSQTNDAVFHLNALRWIAETGSASSWSLNGLVDGRGFYPAAWHGLASVVMLVTGAAIPVVTNAVMIVVAVVVWPLGIVWLSRCISRSAGVAAIAGALSPLFLAFPFLMVQWGIVYPYLLSVALVPSAIGAVIVNPVWREGQSSRPDMRGVMQWAFLAVLGAVAIALAQPSSLLTWGLISVIWAVSVLSSGLRERSVRARATRILIALAAIGALAMVWYSFATATSGSHWPTFRSVAGAAFEIVTMSQVYLPAALAAAALTLTGLIIAFRRKNLRWLAIAWLIVGFLYVIAASVDSEPWRTLLIGAWYADPYRVAAISPLLSLPLAAIGLHEFVAWSARRLRPRTFEASSPRLDVLSLGAASFLGVVALVVTPVVPFVDITDREVFVDSRFQMGDDTFLSFDKLALLERLDERTEPDARIIGNPSAGTGFGYFMSERDVYPPTWSQPSSESWHIIMNGLRDVAVDDAVCAALGESGHPQYVLDFGPGEAQPGRYILPEMTDFDGQPGFELVDQVGEASLWRITACSG